MGNSESATSDEEEMANDLAMEESNEVIKVFQPRKLRDELENAVKVRIPSPTREAGDGMEASKTSSPNNNLTQDSLTNSSVTETVKLIKSPLIKLPQLDRNISMEKLPPITDDKVKLKITQPTSPLVPILTGQPAVSRTFHGTKKEKIAKFVPYEPYKAAITPLIAPLRRKSSSKRQQNLGQTQEKNEKNTNRIEKTTCDEIDAKENVREEEKPSFEEPNSVLNREMENKMKVMKTELTEAKKQLSIQIQVNSEVKKLLVASVGEDIEAKVDFLTQDKARLSADIRQYSNKISRDFEEKEKLYVESDLWKSKFLASSVIVDELARWKGMLMHRNEDCDHYIRLMLHERNVLWNSMLQSQEVLSRLKNAFDPLNSMENAESKNIEAASLLGLADLSLATVKDLKNRLLGTTQLKTYESKLVKLPDQLETPAEEGLHHILKNPATDLTTSNLSDLASTALAGAARPHLKKLGDQASGSKSDFKCCTHCNGQVQVV